MVNLIVGDITKHKADVIVNSANRTLLKGSGVCGAIHAVAGRELEEECRSLNRELSVGEVVVTKAYNLPAQFVIHTLGPRKGRDDVALLKLCYCNSLREAERLHVRSISFPAISTGIYGVSMEESLYYLQKALESVSLNFVQEITIFFSKEEDVLVYARVKSIEKFS